MPIPIDKTLDHPVQLRGLHVRTSNAAEMQPDTAKIPDMWARFWAQAGEKMTADTQVYGVYTHYERDHNGEYDVIAAANNVSLEDCETTELTLPAGKYQVFSAEGEMPQTVIDLWGEVWRYYADKQCPHERNFTVDFEHYIGERSVEIYISSYDKSRNT